MSRSLSCLIAAALMAVAVAVPSRAEVEAKSGNIELLPGWYFPENEGLASDPESGFTYGLRAGYNFTKYVGMQGALQGADLNYDLVAPLTGAADISSFMMDLSVMWNFNPESRAVFHAFGGPGYSWTNIEVPTVAIPDLEDDDDVFTLHLGLGTSIRATDRFYIRPDVAGRWFTEDEGNVAGPDSDGDGHTDWQFTLGFGWTFGGH